MENEQTTNITKAKSHKVIKYTAIVFASILYIMATTFVCFSFYNDGWQEGYHEGYYLTNIKLVD